MLGKKLVVLRDIFMEKMEDRNNSYIGYEYITIAAKQDMESFYTDNYTCFGWIVEKITNPLPGVPFVDIKFKRNRKIRNRVELIRLQNQFDSCAKDINALEKSKSTKATIVALSIGIAGAALVTLSVFSYLNDKILLMILLAIPGFVGWGLSFVYYKKTYQKKATQIAPLIEKKYDEMYETCEKAFALLGS